MQIDTEEVLERIQPWSGAFPPNQSTTTAPMSPQFSDCGVDFILVPNDLAFGQALLGHFSAMSHPPHASLDPNELSNPLDPASRIRIIDCDDWCVGIWQSTKCPDFTSPKSGDSPPMPIIFHKKSAVFINSTPLKPLLGKILTFN